MHVVSMAHRKPLHVPEIRENVCHLWDGIQPLCAGGGEYDAGDADATSDVAG